MTKGQPLANGTLELPLSEIEKANDKAYSLGNDYEVSLRYV